MRTYLNSSRNVVAVARGLLAYGAVRKVGGRQFKFLNRDSVHQVLASTGELQRSGMNSCKAIIYGWLHQLPAEVCGEDADAVRGGCQPRWKETI